LLGVSLQDGGAGVTVAGVLSGGPAAGAGTTGSAAMTLATGPAD
jgi:hypothetical protein